jgi:hypothetical protein
MIKSTYAYFVTKRFEHLFYFLYTFIYICICFPAKIWALININDNSWGTSTRKILKNDISIDIFIPIIWNTVLLTGFILNINKHVHNNNTQFNDYILIITPFSLSIFFYFALSIYIYTKRKHISEKVLFDKTV